ncbi:type II toxin-antitoxin system PemK/MazF family toxin [Azotobacter salinestris]|uniref:type II toxin-antitoxin system PemK/MazF family toxin n=1 Tax=Azotobacter salinestris TaxID=69964 RepID=UPI0032E0536E
MVKRPPAVPGRGEIWHLNFDPSTGREMLGEHYCLVLSKREFNEAFGLALVCPISQGAAHQARSHGFLITLMGTGTDTQGNIHSHQVRTLDWRVRRATFKEKAPAEIVQQVLDCVGALLEE